MHTGVRTCVYTRAPACVRVFVYIRVCAHTCVRLIPPAWFPGSSPSACKCGRTGALPGTCSAWRPSPLPPPRLSCPTSCPLLRVHPESEGAAWHSGAASGLVPPIARGHCCLQGSSRGQEPKEAVCCTRTPSEVRKEDRSRTWDHDSTHCPPRRACRSSALIPAGRKQLTRAPPFQRRQPLTTGGQLCVRWALFLSGNGYYRQGRGR